MQQPSLENSQASFEKQLKDRIQALKDLFGGTAWERFQEELRRFRLEVLERAARGASDEERLRNLNIADALRLVAEGGLEAHSNFDSVSQGLPYTGGEYMPLDSEGRRARGLET